VSTKNEAQVIEDARDFLKEVQLRVQYTRRVPDESRARLKTKLKALRAAIKGGDLELLEEESSALQSMIAEHLEPYEKSAWREYAESIAIAIALALFLRGFVFEAFKIPTGSMIPTLLIGDHLFVNKLVYGIRVPFTERHLVRFSEPERGEVVVFSFPRAEAQKYLSQQPVGLRSCIAPTALVEEKDMIKRVIGVEGDMIEVKKNRVFVNGEPLKQTFIMEQKTENFMYPIEEHRAEELPDGTTYTIQFQGKPRDFGPVKVDTDHIFVMGDNRDNSSDGRCWGQVPVANVQGRAMFVWLSIGDDGIRFERFGRPID
jgi:signal peptidase I